MLVTLKAWNNGRQMVYDCLVDTTEISRCNALLGSEKVPIGGGCLVMKDGHVMLLANHAASAEIIRLGQNYDAGLGGDGRHLTQGPVLFKKKERKPRTPRQKRPPPFKTKLQQQEEDQSNDRTATT
jgi:hypothetical protein